MIDEVNTIRDVAPHRLNGTLDGRLSLYLPAEGRTARVCPDRLQRRPGRWRQGGHCPVRQAAALLSDGSEPITKVPAIRVGGGTAFAGDAIAIGAGHLEIENRRCPRAVWILSDGGWYDSEVGVRKIRWLAELGVPRSTSRSAPSRCRSRPVASAYSPIRPTA